MFLHFQRFCLTASVMAATWETFVREEELFGSVWVLAAVLNLRSTLAFKQEFCILSSEPPTVPEIYRLRFLRWLRLSPLRLRPDGIWSDLCVANETVSFSLGCEGRVLKVKADERRSVLGSGQTWTLKTDSSRLSLNTRP